MIGAMSKKLKLDLYRQLRMSSFGQPFVPCQKYFENKMTDGCKKKKKLRSVAGRGLESEC